MLPSIWTDVVRETDPDEAIRIIGEAGFRYVEFGLRHEAGYLEGREDEGARLRKIRQAAEQADVAIVQMHGHMFNLCNDDAAPHIEQAHRSLRRAAALGVRWVVLHPGTTPLIGAEPDTLAWVRQRNLDVFRELVATAEEVGTGIAIENMPTLKEPWYGGHTNELLWLVDELKSDHVGICWDTGHAELSRLDQPAALRAIGSQLVAMHIADNDGQADRHWAPLRGQVDWQGVLRTLHAIDYRGPFSLEVPGESRIMPLEVRPAQLRYLYQLAATMVAPKFIEETSKKTG